MFGFLKRRGRASQMTAEKDEPYGQGEAFELSGKTSIYNLRELSGYETPFGTTLAHRFLRCGALDTMKGKDVALLRSYGVDRICDLRGAFEVRSGDGPKAKMPGVTWLNVPLFDYDLSAKDLMPKKGVDNYLTESYFTILANKKGMKRIFEFFAEAQDDECVLFHCAAGMDRTGVTSMLILSLCGVDRPHIIADYCYSFGGKQEVDRLVLSGRMPRRYEVRPELYVRIEAISIVYDRLIEVYGSADAYLDSCGIMPECRRKVKEHLLGRQDLEA